MSTPAPGPWPMRPGGHHQPGFHQPGVQSWPPQQVPVGPARPALTPGHRALAGTVCGFLLAIAAFMGLEAVGQVWLGWLASRSATGDPQDVSTVQNADLLATVAVVLWGLCVLVTAVLWCVWQVKLASSRVVDPRQLRRGPGMHAGSWFIPIVWLWFPYQNMGDLDRAVPGPSSLKSRLSAWWALWLAGGFFTNFAERVREPGAEGIADGTLIGSESAVLGGAVLTVLANGLFIAAAILAVGIVRDLTQRAHRAEAALPQPMRGPWGAVGHPGQTWEPTPR